MEFSGVVWNSLIAIFYWIIFLNGTSGQFDENFTLQNVWGRLQPNMRSIIQCLSDDNHKKIKFSRLLDTGQGPKLPKSSQQFMQGNPVFARILFMPKEDQLNRFGAFQCKVVRNQVETKIIALKLPPANLAELDALSPYNVANFRDSVQLEVNVTKKLNLTVKWRHNGVELPEWDDHLKIELNDLNVSDSGIYEAYYEGRRSLSLHALMRLIVRGMSSYISFQIKEYYQEIL
ncbi:uncharacterized protein LOC118200843 [Stegodyphus dumicola]|uniref:uncharacterized protein LOC118200843 n=1 Tax=Stegodyphus dumicola TaxID=202533 RepID=UPI0015B2F17A|nr:uncharacterized protein LOC118200843 [Stegodyphus dumicola]